MSSDLRRRVAVACRILAHAGLCEDVLGHVSARLDDTTILVRARGPAERGLLFTTVDDIRRYHVDGTPADGADGYEPPKELPIHLACLRADPSVGAVVHAHPPAVIAADLAGVPLVPMVGAYHLAAARLAVDGIPVYPRAVLVDGDERADELVAAMAGRPACVMRGHGLTTTGATVEQALARALAVDVLARMGSLVVALGGQPVPLPEADLATLPDLGSAFTDELIWRHHEARLEQAGLALAPAV